MKHQLSAIAATLARRRNSDAQSSVHRTLRPSLSTARTRASCRLPTARNKCPCHCNGSGKSASAAVKGCGWKVLSAPVAKMDFKKKDNLLLKIGTKASKHHDGQRFHLLSSGSAQRVTNPVYIIESHCGIGWQIHASRRDEFRHRQFLAAQSGRFAKGRQCM